MDLPHHVRSPLHESGILPGVSRRAHIPLHIILEQSHHSRAISSSCTSWILLRLQAQVSGFMGIGCCEVKPWRVSCPAHAIPRFCGTACRAAPSPGKPRYHSLGFRVRGFAFQLCVFFFVSGDDIGDYRGYLKADYRGY